MRRNFLSVYSFRLESIIHESRLATLQKKGLNVLRVDPRESLNSYNAS